MNHSIPQPDPLDALPSLVKRDKYVQYTSNPALVNKVIEILKLHRRGDIPKISKHTKFKINTLYEWTGRLKKDPNFSPLKQKYGENKRIFTIEEEDSISDYIITQIIMKGILFTDQDFEDIVMAAFLEKYRTEEDYNKIPHFVCSKGFIYSFKQHHGITSRKCHLKRRPDNKAYDKTFAYEMHQLFEEIDKHYICNIDETSLMICPSDLRVWHSKGEDHVVRYNKSSTKDRITVVAGITADGNKLPLQFITKGKTEVSIANHIGDVEGHMKACTDNGWTTEETFCQYLTGVRNYYGFDNTNTIHMILDVFKVHISERVKACAHNLNIKLYVIPAGMTDELQPLDRKIFGPLKAFVHSLFRKKVRESIDSEIKLKDACQNFIRAWERLSPDLIEDSFSHLMNLESWYIDGDGTKVILEHHHYHYCTMTRKEKRLFDQNNGYKQ